MTILSWFEDYGSYEDDFFTLSSLGIDEAFLSIDYNTSEFYLYKKHVECIDCPYLPLFDSTRTKSNIRLRLSRVPYWSYRLSEYKGEVLSATNKYICEFGTDFGEFGIYGVNATKDACTVTELKEPVSIAFPVLTVILLYAAIFCILFGFKTIITKLLTRIDKVSEAKSNEKSTNVRVRSLDTFRGIAIVVMIFVNYGAGEYQVIDHAVWNGLHVADLVFPWFMWIMGAVIPISLMSSFKKKQTNQEIFFNVLKRSIKLFCLGIFLGGGSSLNCLRIFGVLQRFGITYLAATTICLFLIRRDYAASGRIAKMFEDVLKLAYAWIAILVILAVYLLILFFVADEGCPQGYMGPGGLHANYKYEHCSGGATGYIDKLILGRHRYSNPSNNYAYASGPFDPEGILGCLTSTVHVFLGVQAGMVLLTHKRHSGRLVRWALWSAGAGLLGGALCGFSRDGGAIPVNKNLWSLSFVLVTSCFAFALLAACYLLIDVKRWWSGKPFLFAGMNAILLYVGHMLVGGNFPARWVVECGEGHPNHFFALFENLWGAGFWVVVSYYWYKIKYFFTI